MVLMIVGFLFVFKLSSCSGTCEGLECNDDNKAFQSFIRDVLLKHLIALQRKRSLHSHDEIPLIQATDDVDMYLTKMVGQKNILVMNMALSLENFLLQESEFLNAIESSIPSKNIKCEIADASEPYVLNVLVDLYCFYAFPYSKRKSPTIFVPLHKLIRLMTSGNMRGFLQKYNVTKFESKAQADEVVKQISSSSSFSHNIWFPIILGIGGFLIVFVTVMLYCLCCRKKKIEEGEFCEPSPKFGGIKRHSSFAISPMKQRNSFSRSPKKFSYSPQKNSTPIFSFTSPTKFKDKVIYPVKSPIETTPPSLVQPQLSLLFPVGSAINSTCCTSSISRNSLSSRSSGGSTLERSSKNLLQSRRGSSASLIIDLSPKSPVHDFITHHESPTEEILLRKSRALRYRQLNKVKENDKELHEEFWSIPPNTVSRKESNLRFSLKNRYPDILPNSKTLVKLKAADQSNVYINANFVKGYNGVPNQYIATQGPLACTLVDFWLMVWQYNCSIMVMITKLKEKNKDKCVQYWPSPETVTQQVYGEIIVTYDSEMERDGYKIITFYISRKSAEESRKISHFWFTSWPDHKVPKETSQIISMVKQVRQLQTTQSAPVIIHCSAGRGRTGCFIALSLGMSQIDEENEIDVLKIVSRMRMDRGGMVDKEHQYIFVYKVLYEYWSNKRRRSSVMSPVLKRILSSLPTSSSTSSLVSGRISPSSSCVSTEQYDKEAELDESLNDSLDEAITLQKIQSFSFTQSFDQ